MNFLEKIKEEGKLENKLETARKMKDMGLSIEVILKAVGLSENQLKRKWDFVGFFCGFGGLDTLCPTLLIFLS
jgi:hypothetical protein